jgi:hypothetical protein
VTEDHDDKLRIVREQIQAMVNRSQPIYDHPTDAIMVVVEDALAEQRDLIAESIEPSPDGVIDECCSNALWAASVRVRRAES